MQVIKDNKSLAEAIAHFESVKKSEGNLLKEHFKFTIHSLNPINIVKEKFNETIHAPGIKGKILSSIFGIATGYFTNNLIVGSSSNPLKKIVGSFVQNKVASLSTLNTDDVKDKSISFLSDTLQKLKIK